MGSISLRVGVVLAESSPQKLIDFRNQNLIDFEVILIGAERNKDAQLKYMQKFQMPWYAVDSQSQRKPESQTLAKKDAKTGIRSVTKPNHFG